MAVHLFNESFIHLLIAQDILLSNKTSIAQYFVLDQYSETVFQDIIFDISTAKVSTAGKIQFKTLQHEMPKIELDITHINEATIYFKNRLLLN